MKRRKINSLDEIWDGKRLKTKDFSNLDLEGINLSRIPKWSWKNCIFNNTSLKNTGIKFKLNKLDFSLSETNFEKNYIIKDCDFTGNNLKRIFKNLKKYNIEFESCDFTDTNISNFIYGKNNTLDQSCTEYDISFKHSIIDAKTIVNSPNLNVDITILLGVIQDVWEDEYINDGVKIFKKLLEHKDANGLKKLYNILNRYMDDIEIFQSFASGRIVNKSFNEINLGNIDKDIFERVRFYHCTFKKIIFDCDISQLFCEGSIYFWHLYHNIFYELVLPKLKYDSWNEVNIENRLIKNITFRKNLYLELGRACNAKCEFCRNAYYCNNEYDLDSIKSTLHNVIPKLDSIVIGGGEPTLLINDLKKLINYSREEIERNNVNLYLFTNGTHKYIDDELCSLNFNYNISRHAVDDDENARIFGIDKKKIMSTLELEEFIERGNKTTLAATCFAGGLDSEEKIIEYINYAIELGCKSILLSDLMVMEDSLLKNKENYNINIDHGIFDSVINYLMINGFKRSIPIYATGGYVLTMLKKGGINISFKHYISKKELEENWPSAIKRTFDLSIDPNGNLYENWHQTSGLVKTLKN